MDVDDPAYCTFNEIMSAPTPPPRRHLPSEVDLAKEETICPMCIGVFRSPRSLQCLHSYCEDCIQNFIKSSYDKTSITCPECRSETPLPEDGVRGLPVNFKLQRFVEILSTKQKDGFAPSQSPTYTRRVSEPVTPQLAALKSPTGEASATSSDDLKCTVHKTKNLEYFCEECEVLVCGKCMLGEHRLHEGVEYACDVLPKHVKALKASLTAVDATLAISSSTLDSLHSNIIGIKNSGEEAASEVKSYFENVHRLLQQREATILEGIGADVSRKEKRVVEQIESLQESTKELQKCTGMVQDIEENKENDIRVLIEEPNVRAHIKHQIGHLETIIANIKIRGRVSFQSSFTADSYFEAQCKSVGENPYQRPEPVARREESIDMAPPLPPNSRPRLSQVSHDRQPSDSVFSLESSLNFSPYSPSRSLLLPRSVSELSELSLEPSDVTILAPYLEIAPSKLLGSTPRMATVYPYGVCIGNPDSLIVTDSKNGVLRILTPTGKCLDSIVIESKGEGNMVEPAAVATNEAGNIFLIVKGSSNTTKIQKYSPSGKFMMKVRGKGHLGDPAGLTVLPNGNLLVTDPGKSCVHVFEGAGNGKYLGILEIIQPKQPLTPTGITHDNRGNLIIADRGNHCVWVYTNNGRYVTKFGRQGSGSGELLHPYGVASDLDGNIFVSESGNHRISVFSISGKFLGNFGKKGSEPGMFHYPRHICVDSHGRLVVADEHNQRLQIFDVKDFIIYS